MKLRNLFRLFEPLPTIIVLVVAVPFLFIGMTELFKAQSMIENFTSTRGTVIGTDFLRNIDAQDSTISSWTIHPRVRFTTPQGQEVSFTDSVGSYPADYEVGDKVEVLYNPENPREATIKNWKYIWFAPLWITAIGLLPILGLLGWASWRYVQAERIMKASRKSRRR
ncbi:MAG: DUF3592 domain-containing protein [Anaerolineales bacterium]|nr:DUF3592 domain-containing protein [Anaerolineales bacterium]